MSELEETTFECTIPKCAGEVTNIYIDEGYDAELCKEHAAEYDKKAEAYRTSLMKSMHTSKAVCPECHVIITDKSEVVGCFCKPKGRHPDDGFDASGEKRTR